MDGQAPKENRPKLDIQVLKKLIDPAKDLLFKEYSAWARHHHTLIWTAAAFGISIQVVTLLMYKDLTPWPYTIMAVGSLVLLFVAHKLAEGNRQQWQDYKSVANLIEAAWDLRIAGTNAKLNAVDRPKDVRVQVWRRALYIAFAFIVGATILVKWFDQVHYPQSPNQGMHPTTQKPNDG